MRLLLLSDDFPPESAGGAGFVAANLAQAFGQRGHAVTVVTTTREPTLAGKQTSEGLTIIRLFSRYHERWRSWRSLSNPRTVPSFRSVVRSLKPDVTHSHNLHTHLSYASLVVARAHSRVVCLTAHDTMLFHYSKLNEFLTQTAQATGRVDDYRVSAWQQLRRFRWWYNPVRNLVIRRSLKAVDQLFAVSFELKRALEQNGFRNIAVIHNGLDVRQWKLSAERTDAFRQRLPIAGQRLILFGGRLSQAKGSHQMILALPRIIQRVPDAKLLVIGRRGADAAAMEALARRYGVFQHLVFTGWLAGEDLKAAYHVSQVVVVPSVYLDPFPLVCQEAMVCAKPVVATCFGGAKEVVEDGQTGFIVNPFRTDQLADRVATLLEQPKLRQRFGSAGFARMQTHFSLDHQAEVTLDWYRRLANRQATQ